LQFIVNGLFLFGIEENPPFPWIKLGLKSSGPLQVTGANVRTFSPEEFLQNMLYGKRRTLKRKIIENAEIRFGSLDDYSLSKNNSTIALSRTWTLVSDDKKITQEQLDVNTCIAGGKFGGVHCLPAFMIIGFEKCSTTALNIFLSYHPNLLTNWLESRFFDHVRNATELEEQWRPYLQSLPAIPGGESGGLGNFWTFEKSPSYAVSFKAPRIASALVPNTRLLAVTRNPTRRAYSMFLMFTNHYKGISNAIRNQPVSFFVKNVVTGDVRCVTEPGLGGDLVPEGLAATTDEWRFLSYPPDPKDFDVWVRHATEELKLPKPYDTSRSHRIIFGGFYSHYLKNWLKYFPQENFVVIPSEQFFTEDVSGSLERLQTVLGLPVFDYSTITTKNQHSGRIEIDSPAFSLNSFVNNYQHVPPMLDSTRQLLDDFYCKSNEELSRMLGGNEALPGYSCASEASTTL
jgi:hypothetical protein